MIAGEIRSTLATIGAEDWSEIVYSPEMIIDETFIVLFPADVVV